MVIYPRIISQSIEKRIFSIRGSRVILDSDIASL